MSYFKLLEDKVIVHLEYISRHDSEMRKKASIKIEKNYRLHQFLQLLSKGELDAMRKRLRVKGVSTLLKKQLADSLEFCIRRNLREVAASIGVDEFNYLVGVLKEGGCIAYDEGYSMETQGLMEWGLLFTGSAEEESISIIPSELREGLDALLRDSSFIEERRKRWFWDRAVQGILSHYGVMDKLELVNAAEELLNEKLGTEFIRFISNISGTVKSIDSKGNIFYDRRVVGPEKLYEAQKANRNLVYKALDLEDILELGERDFWDWTAYDRKYHGYLITKLNIEDMAAAHMVEYLRNMLLNGFAGCMEEYIERCFGHLREESRTEIRDILEEMERNTISWALKGHTPLEVERMEVASRSYSELILT